MKKVALDYGWEFPNVPEALIKEIEDNREEWCQEAIWDHLKVPKPARDFKLTFILTHRFESCRDTWSYGRHIYSNRVVIKRPGKDDRIYSITTLDNQGKTLTLPDPRFYL